MVNVVAGMIREAGMTALEEPQGVFEHHRPDVITSPCPGGYRTWIIDVTIRGAQQLIPLPKGNGPCSRGYQGAFVGSATCGQGRISISPNLF